jgi:hypothetical protein
MDVHPSLVIDDEYWTTGNPESAFRQPQGKTSHMEAFGFWLALTKISAFAVNTLVGGPGYFWSRCLHLFQFHHSMWSTSLRWPLLVPQHPSGGNGRSRNSIPRCPSGSIHYLITVRKFPWPTRFPFWRSHLTLTHPLRSFTSPLVPEYGQPRVCHPIRNPVPGILPQSDPDISAVHSFREIRRSGEDLVLARQISISCSADMS